MKVTTLDEGTIGDIGHAFGYYDYGTEHGLIEAFPSRDAAGAFICGYVRMALQSGMLYTTGENGEGYIAYRLPGKKIGPKAVLLLVKALFGAMKLRELIHFARIMSKGGPGLSKRLDREKKPYVYVGMVCVREPYQGRAICGRSWSWRLPRAIGLAYRWSSIPMPNPSAINTGTLEWSLSEHAGSVSTERCMT